MKNNWKNFGILVGLIILDFILVILMRMVTPEIFILRLSIIILIGAGSMFVYYFIVKPENWFKESVFVATAATIIATLLTILLHGIIEKNLNVKHISIPIIAIIVPFTCGGIYNSFKNKKNQSSMQ